MSISFFNQANEKTKDFERLIRRVFASIHLDKHFNIIFVDDVQIQNMNKQYRKIDKVTDVISFALCDDDENEMVDELGDIFIDLQQARRQAETYGHTIEREVAFLAVHGYLHLCGYDHMTKEEELKMFQKQDEILLHAGIERK